jgi:hypothetical protein
MAAGVGLIAACDAPTAIAPTPQPDYSGSPLMGDTFFYRWRAGKTIAIYADTTGAPTGFDLRAATSAGAASWNGLARFADYRLVLTQSPSAADVVIRYKFSPSIVDLRGCEPFGGGAGRTAFCIDSNPAPVLPLLDGGGGRVKVEVYVDPEAATEQQLQLAGMTRQEHFVALVTHELGHVLGIGSHSGSVLDVMNGFPRVMKPSVDDELVLQWVWLQEADLLL